MQTFKHLRIVLTLAGKSDTETQTKAGAEFSFAKGDGNYDTDPNAHRNGEKFIFKTEQCIRI